MIEFLKNMVSGGSEVSSKRVAGIAAFLAAVIGKYAHLLDKDAFEALLMYSGTMLSASIVTTIFSKKS
jgi:hypothetical protein